MGLRARRASPFCRFCESGCFRFFFYLLAALPPQGTGVVYKK
jgi:hypothetical protein